VDALAIRGDERRGTLR